MVTGDRVSSRETCMETDEDSKGGWCDKGTRNRTDPKDEAQRAMSRDPYLHPMM